jgi:hypothetical protein
MPVIDYSQIEALHTAARRERSYYVHCLLIRAGQSLRSLLPNAAPAQMPCCEPA